MSGCLKGRVALVGGTEAQALPTAMALARFGADVMVAYEGHWRDAAEACVGGLRALGRRATALPADLSQSRQAFSLKRACARVLGCPSILVQGVDPRHPRPAGVIQALGVLAREVLPSMLEARWGRVIYVVEAPSEGRLAAYARSLTSAYGPFLCERGVTVNTVLLGEAGAGRVGARLAGSAQAADGARAVAWLALHGEVAGRTLSPRPWSG